jgi:copper chaperone CopZ
MRRFVVIIIGLVVCAGVAWILVAQNRPDTVRTVFTIDGMHCDGCSSAITTALEGTQGVIEASADWERGSAEAVYHARRVEIATLEAEIEELGYTVTGTKTEALEG